ncbi:MAG: WbuC family cupin fold metalloprotein [Rhodocyclaceae bacterium]|nr:WbuC family cupin fold metalloprotein [Rhodocyclaceae bacterium]
MIRLIDRALLNEVSGEAVASPRRRKNRNFHPSDDFVAHRLLNAIEPGSYIAPHRHNDPHKDETMVVLRGRLGLVEFDAAGAVLRTTELAAGGEALGCDIPHGTWHTTLALEPGTVFLEAKAGPYLPLTADERAGWAPAEGAAEATPYLATLAAHFR